jgi:8-oxo-dGTP pyrophosphatase MutT (NUDIX family)
MISAGNLVLKVRAFVAGRDGEATKSKELILSLLEGTANPFSRHLFSPGHITGTGVVLSPKRRSVLLVHHRRLDRWLLPGGHVEAEDDSVASTAYREVLEETGARVTGRAAPLVGMDVHSIPGNAREPYHLHHDLIFAFQATTKRCECSAESRAVSWCKLSDFERYALPDSIRRAVKRAVAQL